MSIKKHVVEIMALGLVGFNACCFRPLCCEADHQIKVSNLVQLKKSEQRLIKKINRLAKENKAVIGVCARDVATGYQVAVNGKKRFPMASTYKVPLAMAFLSMVDDGLIDLNERVEIKAEDWRPCGGPLSIRGPGTGMVLMWRDIFRLMLEMSDNTATDLIFKKVGGPEMVNAWLRKQAIDSIHLDRTILQLLADVDGIVPAPSPQNWSKKFYKKCIRYVKAKIKKECAQKFLRDMRDTATPCSMVVLLQKICEQKLLKPTSQNILIDAMRLCQTGNARIPALLPDTVCIAHKTGTFSSVINDVGLITLPSNGGDLALAVFIKGVEIDKKVAERVIAIIAHDMFVHFKRFA